MAPDPKEPKGEEPGHSSDDIDKHPDKQQDPWPKGPHPVEKP